jgi:hypothetical protein
MRKQAMKQKDLFGESSEEARLPAVVLVDVVAQLALLMQSSSRAAVPVAPVARESGRFDTEYCADLAATKGRRERCSARILQPVIDAIEMEVRDEQDD